MRGEDGSAAAEFVLVGTLLTIVTAAILQVGVILYARNILHDAAVDGAYHAALADARPGDAEAEVRQIASSTLGGGVVQSVSEGRETVAGGPVAVVTITATLPLVGLIGVPGAMEVSARAPLESFEIR